MSVKECRICYEDENENSKEMINPCVCSGTQKYVHADCLEQWRNQQRGRIGRVQCQECQTFYIIDTKYPIERYKFEFDLPCTQLEFFYFICFHIFMVAMTGIVFYVDKNQRFLQVFTLGNKNLQDFIILSKKNENTPFLLLSIVFECEIFMNIYKNIITKRRYWKISSLPYSAMCIFNMHFLYLYICTIGKYFEPWIFISGGFSFLNYAVIVIFCYIHNIIINRLNIKQNKEIVLNYNTNSSLSYIKKHYHPPYRHNIILHIENDSTAALSQRERGESESTSISTSSASTSSSSEFSINDDETDETDSSESTDGELIII